MASVGQVSGDTIQTVGPRTATSRHERAAQQGAAAAEPQRASIGPWCRLASNMGASTEPRRRCGSQLSAGPLAGEIRGTNRTAPVHCHHGRAGARRPDLGLLCAGHRHQGAIRRLDALLRCSYLCGWRGVCSPVTPTLVAGPSLRLPRPAPLRVRCLPRHEGVVSLRAIRQRAHPDLALRCGRCLHDVSHHSPSNKMG
jgi:hypothetical protein